MKAGPGVVISQESALYLYGLSVVLPIEILMIMPRTGSRHRMSIRLHTNRLNHDEFTYREGLQVTNVARTIIDVTVEGLAEELICKAIHDAIRQGLISRDELFSTASRRGGKALRIIKTILASEIK